MSNGEQAAAAHVTQVATSAAEALAKVAAAEAAAVIEVAAAAHSNLAPSVLVVSMFETLQRQIEHVAKRLDDGNQWMVRAEKAYQEMADGIGDLDGKVGVQNGGVTRALNWIAEHDSRMESASAMAKGRKAQREDDLAVVRGVQSFIKEWWPLVAGAVLGGIGVGSFLWSTLGGPPW